MSSSSGISCRHGPHQVAQKLIITTWPLNWERSMVLPPRPESWKAGAGPDEEVANAGSTNTAASARSFHDFSNFLGLTVRADMSSLRQKKTVALSSVSMLLVTLVSPNKSESNTRSCTPRCMASQSVGSTR